MPICNPCRTQDHSKCADVGKNRVSSVCYCLHRTGRTTETMPEDSNPTGGAPVAGQDY